jgi:hypothetical protein
MSLGLDATKAFAWRLNMDKATYCSNRAQHYSARARGAATSELKTMFEACAAYFATRATEIRERDVRLGSHSYLQGTAVGLRVAPGGGRYH